MKRFSAPDLAVHIYMQRTQAKTAFVGFTRLDVRDIRTLLPLE
jgi:hypothetical protein